MSTHSNRAALQFGFSQQHSDAVYNRASRRQKALKTLAILRDCVGPLHELTALDLGCAAGNSTVWYAGEFKRVAAVDIDLDALKHAHIDNQPGNIVYAMMNGERLGFRDESFDVVICAHVYEHVPNARALLDEIYRLLKPGGVCFFSAGNRLSVIEPHYRLPFLSVLPRGLSHVYLRALGRGRYYYEKHLTFWGLKRLTDRFLLVDYTRRTVEDPVRYCAEDVVKPGSWTQLVSCCLLRVAYWACPTYLWVLRKPQPASTSD